MHLEAGILERRAKVVREIPWCLPASVIIHMSDADLDELATSTSREYWRTLNAIVSRIAGDVERRDWRSRERTPGRESKAGGERG